MVANKSTFATPCRIEQVDDNFWATRNSYPKFSCFSCASGFYREPQYRGIENKKILLFHISWQVHISRWFFLKIYLEDLWLVMFLLQDRKEDTEMMDASKRLHRVCFQDKGDVKVA